MFKRSLTFASVIAVVLALSTAVWAAQSMAESIAVPAPDGADAVPEIIFAQGSQITTLDPTQTYNQQHNRLFLMVYDRLLKLSGNDIEPELAVEWKWNDDSYTSLYIKLREGVKFHNGDLLTTADVEYTLARATYSLVSNFYEKSEIINDLEMNIVLKEPDADFLYALTANCGAIICKNASVADPDRGGAIGTGPWKIDLASYVVGDRISVVRNDAYWGEKPVTERFTFRYMPDASTRLVALQNGEVHITIDIIPIEVPIAMADKNITTHSMLSTNVNYVAFNSRDGSAADDVMLRRAIARAIDREELILAIGSEGAKPTYTMYSWTMPSFKDAYEMDLSYNIDEARKLADQAKTKSLKIMANTSSANYKTIVEYIQEQCRKIGIQIEIDEVDSAGLTSNSRYATAKHSALVYAAGLFPWDCYVWSFFSPSGVNKAVLDHPRINELMALSRQTDDVTKRRAYNFEIQDIVHEGCYYIPMFYSVMNAAHRVGLGGITIHPNGVHDFRYVKMSK